MLKQWGFPALDYTHAAGQKLALPPVSTQTLSARSISTTARATGLWRAETYMISLPAVVRGCRQSTLYSPTRPCWTDLFCPEVTVRMMHRAHDVIVRMVVIMMRIAYYLLYIGE